LFMEKFCVHQNNAPSMTSLSAGTRNTVVYIRKTRDAGTNKYVAIKANGSRAIAVHNVDNTTNGNKEHNHMARISNEKAREKIGNLFDLVLIASARARELSHGHYPHINCDDKPTVKALREIEEGYVGREYLAKYRRNKNER